MYAFAVTVGALVPSKLRNKVEWLFRRAEGALLPPDVLAGPGRHLDPDGARLALRFASDDMDIAGAAATERLDLLLRAESDHAAKERYVASYGICGVRRFEAQRARIFQIAVETFPRHVNNVYLVLEGGSSLLFDCGSGLPTSERDLALGFAIVAAVFGEDVGRGEIETCVVSHAHVDHWGGVNVLRRTSHTQVAVHELDARVIERFDEHVAAATRERLWARAGVPSLDRSAMRYLYDEGKRQFRAERVDTILRDQDLVGSGYRVHHAPGHRPGLVCLQVHDVLLTSDHVLARGTPRQLPRAFEPRAGLARYLESLEKIRCVEGIRLALAGHEEPIPDLAARITEVERSCHVRLERVLAVCENPRSVHEIARELFGEQEGRRAIDAIDDAAAYVEHLETIGRLHADVSAASADSVIRYVTRAGEG